MTAHPPWSGCTVFARHLSYGLRTVRNDVQELSGAGCPPVIHVFFGGNPRCQGLNDQTLAEVIRAHPARLVLTAYWTRSEIYDASPGWRRPCAGCAKPRRTRIILIGSPPIWRPKLPRLILRRNLDLNQDALKTPHWRRSKPPMPRSRRLPSETVRASFR